MILASNLKVVGSTHRLLLTLKCHLRNPWKQHAMKLAWENWRRWNCGQLFYLTGSKREEVGPPSLSDGFLWEKSLSIHLLLGVFGSPSALRKRSFCSCSCLFFFGSPGRKLPTKLFMSSNKSSRIHSEDQLENKLGQKVLGRRYENKILGADENKLGQKVWRSTYEAGVVRDGWHICNNLFWAPNKHLLTSQKYRQNSPNIICNKSRRAFGDIWYGWGCLRTTTRTTSITKIYKVWQLSFLVNYIVPN